MVPTIHIFCVYNNDGSDQISTISVFHVHLIVKQNKRHVYSFFEIMHAFFLSFLSIPSISESAVISTHAHQQEP